MRKNLVGRNDLRRQVKTLLFACLVFVMGMMLLATDAAKGEDSQLTQPEYTDFYNTQYYYNKLKTSVEADPVRNTYNCFDANIDCVKAAMGIGVNFGNELDWNWGMDNDLPTRQRRYTIRISIGYEDAAGEKEYYYYEQPVNAAGNIYTYQNRENPSQNHAKIKFEKNPSVTMDDSSPINFVKLKVSNSYNKALNKDFTVNVKTLRLYDSNGRELISSDESVLKRHNVRVISSTEWTTVFSKEINSTVGAFSWNDRILQADIQLENFVSDYTGRPGLIYEHSHNQKLVHTGSGDKTTVDTNKLGTLLVVLKSNGVKTIRLPITWYCHMDSTGTIDSEWLAEIKKVVDAMVAEGFYVIINIHHDTGEKGWIKADSNLFNEYQWTYRYLCLQLAQSFKTYGDHLIMQGPNEVLNYKNYKTYATNPGDGTGPITDEEYGVMNQLNNIFVEEIRRAGYNNKNRILLCNTYFSARLNLPKFVMPTDTASNKILVGIHDYTIRTGENNYGLLSSLEWLGNKTPSGGYEYLDPEGEYKYNILMDEFGIYNTESLDKRKALMNISVPASYELGIPMIIWDEGGDYAVMKKDGAQWDESTNSDQVAAAMIVKAEENALPLHDFEEATYTWSSNKKTCTANRKCKRQGCSHAEEERATTSAETTKKATCEEAGEITYTANFSNEAFGTQETKTPIPAKGHSPESSIIENVVEPTCENDGSHDEVVYCSVCETELSRIRKTDKALGHEWGETAYTWNEDKSECTARRVCSRDKSHIEEETEDASVKVDEATCEEAGEITYTANFSNEAFGTQETKTPIPAKGHSPESSIIENIVEPTCENDGSHDEVVYCSDCKKELSRDKKTESALGHNWGEPTYTWNDDKSKCTAKRVCSRDKSHIEEETEKASVKVDEATCEKAGETTYTANFSNEAFETQITKTDVPAKGHSPGSAKIENSLKPTCEKDGSRDEVVYCSVCKKELSRDKKTDNALGHIWREPTYTWSGDKSKCTAKRNCGRDNNHTQKETVNASVKVVEATCEKAGETTYTANFSNEAFETQITKTQIPAKGHNFGVWFKCDASQHQRICGNNPTHNEKENHMWDEGVITRQPTGNMEGLKEYHCTVCGEVKTDSIPRLPAGTDVNQKGSDGTALGEGASEAAAEKAITEMKSDSDPAGSKFNMLQLRSVKQAKTSVTVTWKKVKNAKKYLLYGNACGKKNKMKKIATLSAGKKSYVVKKAAGKKVKKGTYYKFLMVAVDGNGNVLSTSKVIHVASKGGKVGNHKSVTITAKVNAKGKAIKKYKALSKTVIKKGKKITLKCNPVPASKKIKVKKHRGPVYESSNLKVAKVSGKGVVKAIKKGTAIIYAYAQNGVFKSVKIIVK